ncbi:D(1B) dopamine receptor [Biomphalaria pfeifferi]|uniref:D(1B) dopamine receptor n=1 Tax=Biomphalaria pfeifferi TaxID=112525 RepID=A0AAD8C2M9_BIOPF|nr:D(1B) dopamine receptor [Biomphalaria pfeifferi]
MYIIFSTPKLKCINVAYVLSNTVTDAIFAFTSLTVYFYDIDNTFSIAEKDVITFFSFGHTFLAYGNILLMSIQRWLLFVHPFVHIRLARTRIAVISLSLNWILPFILSAFFFIKTDPRIYTGYIFPILHCVVFFFLIFFYSNIYLVLKRHYQHMEQIDRTIPDRVVYSNHLKRIKKKKLEATTVLFTVCLLYLVLITPYIGGAAYMHLANDSNVIIFCITNGFRALSHLSNFFTYVLRCPNFKASLKVKWESALGLMRKMFKLETDNLNSNTETEMEIFAVRTISYNSVRDTTTLSTFL